MTSSSESSKNQLHQAAIAARNQSHSPYSKYKVGSALRLTSGEIFSGCNIENASYGLTICAERIALGNAISAGNKNITAVAVYSPIDSISPCGACRQFIIEFGSDVIVLFKQDKKNIQKKINELLPFQFKMPG